MLIVCVTFKDIQILNKFFFSEDFHVDWCCSFRLFPSCFVMNESWCAAGWIFSFWVHSWNKDISATQGLFTLIRRRLLLFLFQSNLMMFFVRNFSSIYYMLIRYRNTRDCNEIVISVHIPLHLPANHINLWNCNEIVIPAHMPTCGINHPFLCHLLLLYRTWCSEQRWFHNCESQEHDDRGL